MGHDIVVSGDAASMIARLRLPFRAVVGFLLIALLARWQAPPPSGPIPIATINPVIGDLSFVVRYGRTPTADDDPTERIATHLAFAEHLLRGRDVSALSPELRSSRTRLLDRLAAYARAGRFPHGEPRVGRLPTWVDDAGTRCAVADMVESAAGPDVVHALDGRFHNAFVAELDDPAFETFVASSGLTRDELAIVQPTYHYDPRNDNHPLQLEVDTSYAAGVATNAAHDDRPQVAMLAAALQWNPHHQQAYPTWFLELDGGVGWATGNAVPYEAVARIGFDALWFFSNFIGADCSHGCGGHRMGITVGTGVDAIGDRIPRAWTLPVEAYWYLPRIGNTNIHPGIAGGVAWRIAGADRALGWTAGLELIRRKIGDGTKLSSPRDLHLGVAVHKLSDVTFVGLTVGLSSLDRHDRDALSW